LQHLKEKTIRTGNSSGPKSYLSFSYDDLDALSLKVLRDQFIPAILPAVAPSEWLFMTLQRNLLLPMASEKAKIEHLIAPILTEMVVRNRHLFTYFSGYTFDVDKSHGLAGRCDFILTLAPRSPRIEAPAFCIVAAKNDNLDNGIPQCVAQMYAAKLFNERRKHPTPAIYGAVSFGLEWQFLRLTGDMVQLDPTIYYQVNLPELLGALQYIIDAVITV